MRWTQNVPSLLIDYTANIVRTAAFLTFGGDRKTKSSDPVGK